MPAWMQIWLKWHLHAQRAENIPKSGDKNFIFTKKDPIFPKNGPILAISFSKSSEFYDQHAQRAEMAFSCTSGWELSKKCGKHFIFSINVLILTKNVLILAFLFSKWSKFYGKHAAGVHSGLKQHYNAQWAENFTKKLSLPKLVQFSQKMVRF